MNAPSPPPDADTPGWRLFFAAFFGFSMIGLALLGPALDGPFVSDDQQFIVGNPYVSDGDGALWEVLIPGSEAHFYAGGSYQPVTHLLHALEWQAFGSDTRGYHVTNVVLHGLNAALLVMLLIASSVPERFALLAGALFAVHPANVEAVAWISQSRTLLATGFALAALLVLPRRPLASTALFAAAICSKSIAAFAIPMAVGFVVSWGREGRPTSRHALALGLWLALFLAILAHEVTGLSTLKPVEARAYGDAATTLRSMSWIGVHYLLMAATSAGTSAFHEPEPIRSWLDPGWLAGLAIAPFFLWRIASGLRHGNREAAWWLGAAAAFAPVSQIVPFFFPMGDRYLYTLLPGLLGGALLASRDAVRALRRRGSGLAGLVPRVALVLACVAIALFAMRTQARSQLWVDEERLVLDAASQYPNGMMGRYVAALAALSKGHEDVAIAHLRASVERGAYVIRSFASDPRLASLKRNPRFQALLRDASARRIAFARSLGANDQYSLRSIASAHYLRGELDLAIAALEEALERGGPLQAELQTLVERLRRERNPR